MQLIIGSHVSFNKDKQMLLSVTEALSYKANTFMFYTGAPQNTKRVELDDKLIEEAKMLMISNNIDINDVVVHAPYIINPANSKNRDFNISFLKQEVSRVGKLGVTKLVLHPGSHVGLGVDVGINNIVDVLKNSIDDNTNVDICLETMAGKGSEIGRSFEEIKSIIDKVGSNHIKVCLDTCHINDAGYDLVNHYEDVFAEFDRIIGLDQIAVFHVNDSMNPLGAHKDRHANIGKGTIGYETLHRLVHDERFLEVPKILETPWLCEEGSAKKTIPPYKEEIAWLLQ